MNRIHLFFSVFVNSLVFCGSILPQKVLICGVCQNIAPQFSESKKIVESIGSLFSDYRIILYENNSKDSTSALIQDWKKQNKRVFIKTETLTNQELAKGVLNQNQDGTLFRIELLAKARNEVLKMMHHPRYDDFQYVIWVDMDFTTPPNLEGFVEIFQSKREWDAVFANGVDPDGIYWDWYACRFSAFPFGPELLGKTWYESHRERKKSLRIRKNSNWIPVYSAFGGCGIYKRSAIRGCSYSGIVTRSLENVTRKILNQNKEHAQSKLYFSKLKKSKKKFIEKTNKKDIREDQIGCVLFDGTNPLAWRMNSFAYNYPTVCEHVPFHAAMIEKGHNKLFICPRLVFYY